MIGGVCAGIAEQLGVDVLYVRLGAIVLSSFGGIGVALYALAWVLVPAAPGSEGIGATPERRPGARREAAGVGLLVLAGLLALRQVGVWPGDGLVWPLVFGSSGLALIWRQADATAGRSPEDLRAALRPRAVGSGDVSGSSSAAAGSGDVSGSSSAAAAPRRGLGGFLGPLLVVAAAIFFLRGVGALGATGRALGGIVVVAVVASLVFAPYLVRLARSLADERAQRIRQQERAEVAAHLHDSVLQTLALIQKRAGDPREVAGLARLQERELRRWLFERPSDRADGRLAGALERAAAEVEERHGVPIEAVVVGDAPLDERLEATVKAAREAMANAARFAGAAQVDLYAEVGEDRVEVFVRDRGAGFDLEAIPPDRRGVRHSILERMQRHGGRATVHTAPGAGTEVELVMERTRP